MKLGNVFVFGLSYINPFALPIKNVPLNKSRGGKEEETRNDIYTWDVIKTLTGSIAGAAFASLLLYKQDFSKQINWKLGSAVSFLVFFILSRGRVGFFVRRVNQLEEEYAQPVYNLGSTKIDPIDSSHSTFLLHYPLVLEVVSKKVDLWENRDLKLSFYFFLFLTFLNSGCKANSQTGKILLQKLNELDFQNGTQFSICEKFREELQVFFNKEGRDAVNAKVFLITHCGPELFLSYIIVTKEEKNRNGQNGLFYLPFISFFSLNWSKIPPEIIKAIETYKDETKKMRYYLAFLLLSFRSHCKEKEEIGKTFLEKLERLDSKWIHSLLFPEKPSASAVRSMEEGGKPSNSIYMEALLTFFKEDKDQSQALELLSKNKQELITVLGVHLLDKPIHIKTRETLQDLYQASIKKYPPSSSSIVIKKGEKSKLL